MIIKILGQLMLAGFALFMTASVAFAALTLENAKHDGLVGERPDGLIGAVSGSPSADVKGLVDSTNSARMDKYNAIASKNGTPVDQIQAIAGQKLIGSTPAGEYIMNAAGEWQKK